MNKEKRGTKRLCESCGNKFYDLGRDPIVCPVCETPFVPVKPKPKAEPKPEPVEEAPAATPAEKPSVPENPAAAPDPEFVSLEEAAAEEEVDEDAKLADLGDDEEDIPPDENEDVFLEDDEEDSGSDVSGIIGGPVKPKGES